MEKYYLIALNHLTLTQCDKAIDFVEIPGISKEDTETILYEMHRIGLLSISNVTGTITIQPLGKSMLFKDKNGVEDKNTNLLVNLGHTIHGNISHSDLSIDALNRSNTQPANTQTKQSIIVSIFKWILKNIVQIIIGVIIAAIAYYLGFTKSH